SGTHDPTLQPLRQLTQTWSGHAAVTSVDYRLVRAFRQAVSEAALAPFVAQIKRRYPDFSWPGESNAEAAVWALVRQQPAQLLDPEYHDWHALLIDAAKKVTDDLGHEPGGLAAQQWGKHNRSAINHPLSAALPGWLAYFIDMPAQPQAGDNDMPRVAAPAFGASERMNVAPGHEANGILEMPGGQSDNPLSPYFGAGHADWVKGRPTPLLPGKTKHTLTLRPRASH
ncbi:MAG: penicillin acylase family protein, partial [Rhodanobacter sp.]